MDYLSFINHINDTYDKSLVTDELFVCYVLPRNLFSKKVPDRIKREPTLSYFYFRYHTTRHTDLKAFQTHFVVSHRPYN